jgi:meso-butanediol dehydrogenase / (S,S)-butanediol dehydrogenase / diacetyl reductase
VDAAFLVARAALPHLIESRGSIVSVASAAARRVGPRSSAYCTSKAAMVMMTQTIALDFGPQGVRANAVLPAWVRTDMADAGMDELAAMRGTDRDEAYRYANRNVPLRREASVRDVAELVAWLTTDAAAYMNGAAIPVDGGSGIVDNGLLAFGEEHS